MAATEATTISAARAFACGRGSMNSLISAASSRSRV